VSRGDRDGVAVGDRVGEGSMVSVGGEGVKAMTHPIKRVVRIRFIKIGFVFLWFTCAPFLVGHF
jgi:energy-converting hydrogenase Eha subunit C